MAVLMITLLVALMVVSKAALMATLIPTPKTALMAVPTVALTVILMITFGDCNGSYYDDCIFALGILLNMCKKTLNRPTWGVLYLFENKVRS